ncbi:MAG: site-specific DNA-methyltransferase [bacterium]|nr:site-specific DNA-methyltransferase [bacterium]
MEKAEELMKPYYETELGKLYHGSCEDIIPELEPVDLCLTDPPYGTDFDYYSKGRGRCLAKQPDYGKQNWNKTRPDKTVFDLIQSISTHQIIFGGNLFTDYLPPSTSWIVWDKDNTGNFGDCELAWTSHKKSIRKIKWLWNGFLKESPEKRYHPTQKPVGLFMCIINRYSSSRNLILDPFLGSGTTAIACEALKRRWIGIEISEHFCRIAKERIEAERKQIKMF